MLNNRQIILLHTLCHMPLLLIDFLAKLWQYAWERKYGRCLTMAQQQSGDTVVFCFGVTAGFTVIKYGHEKAEVLHNVPIPWIIYGENIIWPYQWLVKQLCSAKEKYVFPGDILSLGMWGSDMAVIRKNGEVNPLLHYRSATDADLDLTLSQIGVTREDMYLYSGGAAAASYQPLGLIAAQRRYDPNFFDRWLTSPIKHVVPMSTIMTMILTGELGNDSIMLQNMGLCKKLERHLISNLEIQGFSAEMFFADDCPTFDQSKVITTPFKGGEIYVIPMGHDSVHSRNVCFALTENTHGVTVDNWCGSWYGNAYRINGDILPSRETFAQNINFEADAVVTNIGMIGPTYKKLINLYRLENYKAASDLAATAFPTPAMAVEELLDPNFADSDFARCGDASIILASFLKGAAALAINDAKNMLATLGLPEPNTISVTGGWGENKTYIQALACHNLHINATVVRHACNATPAGLAADAQVRMGIFPNLRSALLALPELK